MKSKSDTPIFGKLSEISSSYPRLTLSLFAVLSGLSIWAASLIEIRTSNLDLIDQNNPVVQQFLKFSESFGTPNVLVVAIEHDDPSVVVSAIDQLGPKLRDIPGVRQVLDKVQLAPESIFMPAVSSYLVGRDSRLAFIFIQPDNIRTNIEAVQPVVDATQRLVDSTKTSFSGIRIGLTGIPKYALDDQQIIQKDISVLSWISLALVAVIFIAAFGSIYRPLAATFAAVISVFLSFGFILFYPGHLSVLSAPFAMIVFGQGIDYGIMLISHTQELRSRGLTEKAAIVKAVSDLQRTLLTACATTVGGFLVLVVSGFLGFQELGVIAGVSLVLCLLCMFTVLPALLALKDTRKPSDSKQTRIGRLILSLQKPIISISIAVLSLIAICLPPPHFDSDYLNLQPRESAAVYWERRMIHDSDYSPYFAGFVLPNQEAATQLVERLRKEPTVGNVRSLADFALPGASIQIPKEYLEMFQNSAGEAAVYAYPAKNIWIPEFEREFLSAMRKIDPHVTGMPFLGSEMIQKTKRALWITAGLATLVLVFVVAIDFRRPILVLVVCATPLLSVVWMHAFMRISGVPYNPLNIMALPIVLGIAVDCGVHLAHRYLAEKNDINAALSSSGRSIALTGLTTFSAFGTLCFTSHSGLRSFALLLTYGVGSALIISLTLLPLLLEKFCSPPKTPQTS